MRCHLRRQVCTKSIAVAGTIAIALLATSEVSAAKPFTVVMLPDTQHYSRAFPDQFTAQTQWIVENSDSENIRFVTHVGDIVENGGQGADNNAQEWSRADAAFDILDERAPQLPYGVVLGNHDLDEVNNRDAATQYVANFGKARFEARSWYGRSSPDELNHFQVFEAGDRKYMHISLEWQPRKSSIEWADSILQAHRDKPTILTTHEYTRPDGGRSGSGQRIYEMLVKQHQQIFLVLGGHILGEGHQVAKNGAGSVVIEVLANYQGRPRGGDGWLRLITFDEANNKIKFTTYSPTLEKYEADANSKFSVGINFQERFGPALAPRPEGK